ncbi:cbb3-type cytochrome c oxidase subunit I [Ponticoccus alexandrii]|uniref:Cytochrome ubiquinol oxidase subunit I n=1 Tax=Ponticoccus alexandrii TaxID=1943633 RepID=A0ABX7F6R8_9RHOB|nr:cbb3-type cytochrome c oxidase subunit I [Ponticoccus alexandrii]QRF65819.1 cytochrome ubiquinol oxidase subunit I [Ponticoccus alexandrii]
MEHFIFGRLGWDDIAIFDVFRDPTVSNIVGSSAGWLAVIGGVVVAALLLIKGWWRPLLFEWLNTTDHKKIGIMYIVVGLVMFARGVAEGVVMRTQYVTAFEGGYLTADHFSELFSTHGTIMIFFALMPFLIGFMNLLVPLMIGARDVAFPRLNQISLGFTIVGAMLLMVSLVIGKFATGGWTGYPPYTGVAFQPGTGPDYWIWSLGLSGIGSLLTGLNFAVTIYKMRCPGMTYLRMPIFVWTALCTSILLIFALPPLTAVVIMQALDRYLDFHFFTNDLGGNMMNFANLFWMFGHPEVYILILPAFGLYSEFTAIFAGKRIYGYTSLVIATMAIAVLSFTVWLHHFFTMGQSPTINVAFGIATMLIAIPTGVKVYVWIATLWGGRIRMRTPIIYLAGFILFFAVGGYTGILLANPTINFTVHNSQFVVAHFHNVLLPGTLFAVLASIYVWFPKFFGFRLDERWSATTAWLFIIGFTFAFMPLYMVGLMGLPRRSPAFDDPSYIPYMIVTMGGALCVFAALCTLIGTFVVSAKRREELAVPGGDPWDGRTLEWATPSPVPEWNFAFLPEVKCQDAFAVEKAQGSAYKIEREDFEDIELAPKSWIGLTIIVFGTLLGFAMVFWIWWLAVLSALALLAHAIGLGFVRDEGEIIPADVVERTERDWIAAARQGQGTDRTDEVSARNRGFSARITEA